VACDSLIEFGPANCHVLSPNHRLGWPKICC